MQTFHLFLELKLGFHLLLHKFLNLFSSSVCTKCQRKFISPYQNILCENCLDNSLLDSQAGLKLSDNGTKIYFTSLYKESLLNEVLLQASLDIEEQLEFNHEQMLEFKYRKPELCFLFSEYLLKFFLTYHKDIFKESPVNIIISYVPSFSRQHKNKSLKKITEIKDSQQRHYNQAYLLAKCFYKSLLKHRKVFNLKIKFMNKLFLRIKDTERLYDKSHSEREKELRHAFQLNTANLSRYIISNSEHKHQKKETTMQQYLLIIDDISTTGSTINALAKLLIQEGINSEKIMGFTVLGRNLH